MNNEIEIVLSPKAKKRLEDYANYLYKQNKSKDFICEYLNKIENYLDNTLRLFPESGTLMPDYGKGIRRLSYQRFSILYRVKKNKIEILTFYRQNTP